MAGVYLHIPFCKRACTYCDFYFVTSPSLKTDFVTALKNEIILQKDFLEGEQVETIYFGGGTPSQLDENAIQQILELLRNTFPVSSNAEITLEANPDDISNQKLKSWHQSGINRLSLGLQSMIQKDLKWMHRAHNAAQSREALQFIFSSQINNISVDFIYGLPHQTHSDLDFNLQILDEFAIEHVSCYALTVEEGTPLAYAVRKKKLNPLNDNAVAEQFLYISQKLEQKGFEHYEVSNFAKPNHRSIHNSNYWKGKHFLGLGPAAHGFKNQQRFWNPNNLKDYISSLNQQKLLFKSEILSQASRYNEYIMTGLRTKEGINMDTLENQFGTEFTNYFSAELKEIYQDAEFILDGNYVRLSKLGWLKADAISAALFYVV